MQRLSIGTISALLLAAVASPAALAGTTDSQSMVQNQPVSQLSDTNQFPRQAQVPDQLPPPGRNPGRVQSPGQNPEQMRTPGQMQSPSQYPGQMQTPRTEQLGASTGASLSPDQINPFELSYMAFRNQLEDGGIDGGRYYLNDIRNGDVTGEDVVEAAIDQGYLSANVMDDTSYINRVEHFLKLQSQDWRS